MSLIFVSSLATAAENDTMEVSFVGVEGELLDNVRKHVRLYSMVEDAADLSKGEMQRLRKRAIPEIKHALEPFGYYQASVVLDQAGLPNKLVYQITLNQPVIINSLEIEMTDVGTEQLEFAEWLFHYPLREGERLLQNNYEASKKILIASALRLGYFDARFSTHEILINEERSLADIHLVFASGKRYSVSSTVLEWDLNGTVDAKTRQLIEADLLASLITIKEGEVYDAATIAETQKNLGSTPYFSSVSVQPGETNQDNSMVPIIIRLTPRKRKAYSLEAGVGTDTGVRGGIGYENRRINQRGHNVSVRLGGSAIKRSAIVNYRIPLVGGVNNSLNLFSILDEETGDNRQYQKSTLGVERARDWHSSLFKYGLTASREKYRRIDEEDPQSEVVETETDLLMPSIRWEHVESDNLTFPTRGWSASVTFRAASKSVGSDVDLAQAILEAKGVYPLGDGRLKFRGKVAGSLIDEATDIPESLGFLAGGDESVRGYRYESIGVAVDGEVIVGKNLVVGSMEYQHPIKNGLAVAVFADIGAAFNSSPDFKKGTGLGLRWRLPFGALRLDVASALDRDGKPLRVHFGFGTDL